MAEKEEKVTGYGVYLPKEHKVLIFRTKTERDRALAAWGNKQRSDIKEVKPGDKVPKGTSVLSANSPRSGSGFGHWLVDKFFRGK